MKQYQQNEEETLKLFADKINTVCDYFNHLLAFHDGTNDQYQAIYKLFQPKCNTHKCKHIIIHYGDDKLQIGVRKLPISASYMVTRRGPP